MDDYCEKCGVSKDLHNDEDDCESAQAKVDMMNRFWSIGAPRG